MQKFANFDLSSVRSQFVQALAALVLLSTNSCITLPASLDVGMADDNSIALEGYLLPFPPGVPRIVGQGNFGVAGLGSHANEYAIDFVMPEDSPVLAARGGIVVAVRDACPNVNCPLDPSACCGNYVRIQHADLTAASYFHLRQWGSCVTVGDRVERGDVIGRSGNTGYSVMAHLHFAVFAAPGEVGSGDFGPSGNKSMQIGFSDVEGDGVPQVGRWYFSANEITADHCSMPESN